MVGPQNCTDDLGESARRNSVLEVSSLERAAQASRFFFAGHHSRDHVLPPLRSRLSLDWNSMFR